MLFLRISRRTIAIAGIVLLLGVGVLSERFVSGPVLNPKPLEQVKTSAKAMAFTINVDWGEEFIPGILDVLDKEGSKVTFFVTGRWAKNHPELLKEMAARGHQIENHGYSHPHPDRLSVGANQEEIKKTESIILGLTGYKTKYYAPPYGETGSSGLTAAKALGYQTVLWTLDTVDWRPESGPEVIASRILRPAVRFGVKTDKRGAIVLMHPKENTLKALPGILRQLAKEGYRIVRLDELITLGDEGNTTS